jgi:hypothetical protein
MNEHRDPTRWLEPGAGAPEGLRRLLEASAASAPDAETMARMRARVAALSKEALGRSLRAKVTKGIVIAVAGGAAVVAVMWRPHPALSPTDTDFERPTVKLAVRLDPPSQTATAVAELERGATAPVPVPGGSAGPPETESGPSEPQWIENVRSRVRTDPRSALGLCDQYPARFPHGALREERDALRVDALARIGDTGARAAAEAFFATYPRSVHRARLEVLVGLRGAP